MWTVEMAAVGKSIDSKSLPTVKEEQNEMESSSSLVILRRLPIRWIER